VWRERSYIEKTWNYRVISFPHAGYDVCLALWIPSRLMH
jgi:hypothetical protein